MINASRHLKHIFQYHKTKPCSSLAIPRFRNHIPFIGSRLYRYNLLATQASPEEEVTAEVLNQILTTIENAPKPNGEICTAYVDKLCEAGNLSAAARLLQSLRDKHNFRSPKAYNLLLGAASERHDIELLSQVFKDLLVSQGSLSSTSYLYVAKAFAKTSDGIQLLRFVKEVSAMTSPSATVINRIIFAFAECGQVDKALLIYDLIKSLSCKPDLITYNTILDILGRAGRTDEMLHEFASMKGAGIVPDFVSYNTLLNNLRKVGRVDLCLVYFRDMGENGVEPDLLTYTALIESFGRSGNIEESIRLFKEMKLRQIRPSIYVYRSLIKNLKKIGKLELAMKYLEEMNSCLTDLAGPNDFKRRRR
ncbi:pentatricopeptide repeat-containing protein At1g11900 [Alnus glutinosa]|uniref:pentatricopeptide repeat-containing protein At1g11900 n=1 Tax=Alnus glutinosa TaxID=3517 RepID=UPI002D794C83|nr:pentatricopeptide repeat-containing protein At1g11900 [Alnus glutinosa]XP_062152719.1 pentatricopeptide repeat-containing protein At1g11900 [Alnus glutinosa]XP_062152721.1 pentatricopeptide repeat-containing protein At1g11900 [Alnus glutinosa]